MKLALVIDRDSESVKLVRAILRRWDFAVSSAATPAQAVNMIRVVRPHIVLCDIVAPIADTFAFVRELRNSRDSRLTKMPVIATTDPGQDVDTREARAAGFDVFLRKPLDPDQLPDIVALLVAASMSSAPPSP